MFKRLLSFFMVALFVCLSFPIGSALAEEIMAVEDDYKYYTRGIVDGGIYKIKNKQTGLYMTLENSSTAVSTRIVLESQNQNDNQHFYVKYLGTNQYTFEPYSSNDVKLSVASAYDGQAVVIDTKNTETINQRFRITALNSNYHSISTGASQFEAVLTASQDSTGKWQATQKDKNSVTTENQQWLFEKTNDTVHDHYTTYYIRDIASGLYLTVGRTVTGSDMYFQSFTGDETQRFKKYNITEETQDYYYYVPMAKTDMAVEMDGSAILTSFDQNKKQKIAEIYDEESQGYKVYSLPKYAKKYLHKGAETDAGSNVFKATTNLFIQLTSAFSFETAQFATPFIGSLSEETIVTKTSTNYGQKNVYTFIPKLPGDYNFVVRNSVGNNGISVYNKNGRNVLGTATNQTNGVIYKVRLQKDELYYLYVGDFSMLGNSFSLYCKKDLTVYIHGMNTRDYESGSCSDRRGSCAVPCYDNLNGYDFYDPVINTAADMTADFVLSVDPTTGIMPLQAPIYVFRGHGDPKYAIYYNGNGSSAGTKTNLYADDIYWFDGNEVITNMSACQFAAWVGCKTAQGENTIAEAAWRAGATCSLGFTKPIGRDAANRFTIRLFEQINQGKTIAQSVANARSGVQFVGAGLNSARFFGDTSLVLKPTMGLDTRNTISYQIRQVDSRMLAGYTLKYESADGITKRYVKMIDGFETNDYIDVYYQNGVAYDYYKSKTTYNAASLFAIKEAGRCFEQKSTFSVPEFTVQDGIRFTNVSKIVEQDFIYTYNGEIVPLRFYSTTYSNSAGEECLEIYVFNMKTQKLVPEDVMYDYD